MTTMPNFTERAEKIDKSNTKDKNDGDDLDMEGITKKNIVKDKMKKKETPLEKFKKPREIPVSVVVSLLIFINYKIVLAHPIENWGFGDSTIQLLTEMWFWSCVSVFGLKKVGIFKLFMNLFRILSDKSMGIEDRLQMAMEIIQQWLGVLADVSIFIEQKKTKKE